MKSRKYNKAIISNDRYETVLPASIKGNDKKNKNTNKIETLLRILNIKFKIIPYYNANAPYKGALKLFFLKSQ